MYNEGMNSFRAFVHKNFSTNFLYSLVGFGLIGLGLAGQSFVSKVDRIFSEIEKATTPYTIVANVAHVRKVSTKNSLPRSTEITNEIPNRSLALGESSYEVKLLQIFLKWKGFWPAEEPISGYFGEITLAALKQYQLSVGLPPEGIAGPLTRGAWQRDLANF